MKNKIVAPAVWCSDVYVTCGAGYDHEEIIEKLADGMGVPFNVIDSMAERGFLTSRGTYVDREKAAHIARKAKQHLVWFDGDDVAILHAHNLWPQVRKNPY